MDETTEHPVPSLVPPADGRASGIPTAPPVHPGRPRRRGETAKVVGYVAGGLLALAALPVGFIAFSQYATHDRLELFDMQETVDAAAAGCTALAATLGTPVPDRAEQIARGNAEIGRLAQRMAALDPEVLEHDRPVRGWIEDWDAVVAARDEVRTSVVAGAPVPLRVPQTEDGYDVTERMLLAAPEECSPAIELALAP